MTAGVAGRAEVDGGELAYLERGAEDAPLVLCLHGFPDVPRTFHSLLDRLAEAGYRAVAPWLRGYRPSTLQGPFTLEQLAADALRLADALAPGEPFRLVGHDWGAAATYIACERAPSRIERAVTLAVPHPVAFLAGVRRHPGQVRRSWYMLFFQLPALPEALLRRPAAGFVERLWRDWSPGEPSRELVDEATQCIAASLPGPIAYYRSLFPPALEPLRHPERHRISVPLLHLHGAADGCVAPELADEQAPWFEPGALQTERIEGAGHWLHLEQPDEISSRVLGWLGGPSRARG